MSAQKRAGAPRPLPAPWRPYLPGSLAAPCRSLDPGHDSKRKLPVKKYDSEWTSGVQATWQGPCIKKNDIEKNDDDDRTSIF